MPFIQSHLEQHSIELHWQDLNKTQIEEILLSNNNAIVTN
jgi:hypothetical protein